MKNSTRKIGLFRTITGDLLLALALILATNVSTVMLLRMQSVAQKDTSRTIFYWELVIFGVFLFTALDIRLDLFAWRKPARGLRTTIRLLLAAFSIFILVVSALVVKPGLSKSNENASHAIVLGMALENGQPSLDLLHRIETAKEYLDQHPSATLVLTGGNPQDNKTEAEAMRDLLLEKGVDKGKMILEDQAQTTLENFVNTAKAIDPNEQVVLITSNYHMARAAKTAQLAGFEKVATLPAKAELVTLPANILWETIVTVHETIQSFFK